MVKIKTVCNLNPTYTIMVCIDSIMICTAVCFFVNKIKLTTCGITYIVVLRKYKKLKKSEVKNKKTEKETVSSQEVRLRSILLAVLKMNGIHLSDDYEIITLPPTLWENNDKKPKRKRLIDKLCDKCREYYKKYQKRKYKKFIIDRDDKIDDKDKIDDNNNPDFDITPINGDEKKT